ncbi:specific endoribonuclease-B [Seminavis robusta]|uniref:Specific endoribonuclease-B n=1 Tax=Seminavis robusta TaxID=568900 RepID=A0A9N8D9G6_9STRA|nr:specific endoribonuclease-B [Seminavis robusta]|eukprot:Sro41_g025080.1 specific endoribonuclease-B (471) ;mRNA; r:29878-31490
MSSMNQRVESAYRGYFSDGQLDWNESAQLCKFLKDLNPPPDLLVWLRATAFRIGCEYLSDDKDKNVGLLRTVNAIVHAIEATCLQSSGAGSSSDEATFVEYYKGLFGDLSVDQEENAELFQFFKSNKPSSEFLVGARASAFKAACDFLSGDKDQNVKLFKCVNVVVHAFEKTCLVPKPFTLQAEPSVNVNGMSLTDAAQHLWELDANRLEPNEHYAINVQKGKKPYWKEDSAPDPLFTSVDKSVWQRKTYKTFVALLDNYTAEVGKEETLSNAERQEINEFLSAIMQTAPMQFCHRYCRAKKPSDVPESLSGFRNLLFKIWFELYRRSRGGRLDSSGFEHVFVGEVKDGDVSGFHNWIQFYLEEKRGKVDYRGYIKPKSRGDANADGNDHVLTLQFAWGGVEKFVGTCFIGTSPEFEIALYTMCFLVGEENNIIQLNTGTDVFDIDIRCYHIARDKIGTSFPETKSHYEA